MFDSREQDALQAEIARRAYLRFCDRGCAHGCDVDDWLAAEREVLAERTKAAEPRHIQPAGRHQDRRRGARR